MSDPTSAAVCFYHDERDGHYYMSVSVEGAGQPLCVAMAREDFEEFLDAGVIVFMDLHHHVHTQIALQALTSAHPNLN